MAKSYVLSKGYNWTRIEQQLDYNTITEPKVELI